MTVETVGPEVQIPVLDVVFGASRADLQEVLIIGITKDADLYVASSTGKAENLVALLSEALALIERETTP
jgi:hypothetical protein